MGDIGVNRDLVGGCRAIGPEVDRVDGNDAGDAIIFTNLRCAVVADRRAVIFDADGQCCGVGSAVLIIDGHGNAEGLDVLQVSGWMIDRLREGDVILAVVTDGDLDDFFCSR